MIQMTEKFDLAEQVEAGLAQVLSAAFSAVRILADKIRTAEVGRAGTKNVYGEEQLRLDVLAEKVFENQFKKCPQIGLIASEELYSEIRLGDGGYAVAFDPLDGSSLVDVNFAVGSIVAIYKADSFIGRKGREQVAVLFAVYGPRTTVMLSFGKGVFEYTLHADSFVLSRKDVRLSDRSGFFAPGNLRAAAERDDYLKLLNGWVKKRYTLRYSGGMVPDINHILLKGGGIFTYPAYSEAPDGKLRLLFECAPMAYLVEQAGGMASDGKMSILDKQVRELSQRTPILIGSAKEVEAAMAVLGSS